MTYTMRRTWPDDRDRQDFIFLHNGKDVGRLLIASLSFNPADDDTLTARVEFKVGTDRDRRCFAIGFPAKGVRRI
jgi:hypothetical protein